MIQKTEYSRNMNKSSLILTAEKDSAADRDSIEMFHYNKIPYFLCMKAEKRNLEQQFHYDITGRRSLDQVLEYKTLDYILLLNILRSFDQACIQAGNYMLSENDILLDPAYVFAESETAGLLYCYVPGNGEDICKQFRTFMEYLLQHLEHKDEQAVQFGYGVHQRVAGDNEALHSVLADIAKGNILIDIKKPSNMKSYENTERGAALENSFTSGNIERNMDREKIESTVPAGKTERDIKTGKLDKAAKTEKQEWILKTEIALEAEKIDHMEKVESVRQGFSARENSAQIMENVESVCRGFPVREDSAQVYGEYDKTAVQNKKQDHPWDEVSENPLHDKKKEKKNIQRSRVQQKEQQKKQTGEKIKNLLLKKIYTDHARCQEEIIFEEEPKEEKMISHPTVCLIPETDEIQNRFVYQGSDRTRDFLCRKGKMILGSSIEESDICIPIPLVSRIHAKVNVEETGTFLEDMNSKNGTHVNGELLQYRERRLLQKGDIISLAGEKYSFH